jgi:hypothetical protein
MNTLSLPLISMIILWFCNSDALTLSIKRYLTPVVEACDKVRQITLGGQTGLTQFLLEEIKRMGASLGFGPEFRYWIIFCGLFGPDRNPVKHWRDHEALFLELVRQDGVRGGKQLLQAIILFFTRRHPELGKYAPNFMKLLYD